MGNKEVTMEDLARMVKKGFDGVDERFDENTEQHQEIFNRLGRLEKNQKNILTKLENVVHREEFEELEKRVKKLEETILAVKN